MNTLQLIACIAMIAGCFVVLGLSPLDFTDSIFKRLTTKPKSIKSELDEYNKRKKPSYLRREIAETQAILSLTGKSNRFGVICLASLALFATGASLAVMMGNFFLVPVLAVGFMFLPFWYVKLTAGHYKKAVAAELETALSIITTAYLRNEDILTAVEENVHYLNPPVKNVFTDFLGQVKLVNPDIDAALKAIRQKIDNDVFREWCDALTACQHDRSLKTTLTPIVAKLSDIRIVNAELDYLVAAPRKEFISMVILLVGIIPLMYFLNHDWYNTLMNTIVGQIIIAVCGVAIFVSTAFVIKLTKPIEFKR